MTKAERAAEMSRVRKLGVNRAKTKALGRAVGVAPRTISRWMSGEDRPSPEHHTAIARVIRADRS